MVRRPGRHQRRSPRPSELVEVVDLPCCPILHSGHSYPCLPIRPPNLETLRAWVHSRACHLMVQSSFLVAIVDRMSLLLGSDFARRCSPLVHSSLASLHRYSSLESHCRPAMMVSLSLSSSVLHSLLRTKPESLSQSSMRELRCLPRQES